jgi:predicted molibdopterin-dependent oxidoreductase YjgC
MLPVDNVKTHCQAGSKLKLTQIVSKIYKNGGISNFYSGSSIIAIGCAPAHAIYFSIY